MGLLMDIGIENMLNTKEYWTRVLYTVDENIIATIKMRNNFYHPSKMVILPILRFFLYCSPFSFRSFNFAIAKVVALNVFASIFE